MSEQDKQKRKDGIFYALLPHLSAIAVLLLAQYGPDVPLELIEKVIFAIFGTEGVKFIGLQAKKIVRAHETAKVDAVVAAVPEPASPAA